MRGHEAILRQFIANGIDHMFGNPGTVEQGFLDALADVPEMRYILTLQESIAVLCADGFARARFGPALVQIHSSPGLGNAIGNLYQAWRGQSPLVVIGGDAGIRYQAMEAQMAADLVAMAEPVTKWSAIVQHPSSLLRMVRRAIKVACTPPCGPVYLCVPQDVLDEEIVEEIFPAHIPSFNTAPSAADLARVVDLITSATNPIILVGDGVAWSNGVDELVRLAETIGARVYEADGGEINFPEDHPLYFGSTGHMFGEQSLKITEDCDLCLVFGCYLLPEVFPHLGSIFSKGTKVVHVDSNPANIAKNHPVDISFVCEPRVALTSLNQSLSTIDGNCHQKMRQTAEQNKQRKASLPSTIQRDYEVVPSREDDAYDGKSTCMGSGYFFQQLGSHLPQGTVIFDEALTNSPPVSAFIPGRRRGDKLMTRGGSLGTGFPGAIGVKLARPSQEVVGISGDGGSMYTIQCLWTAARHNVDVKLIVCQNRSYRLLQANIMQYWKEQNIPQHDFPLCFDLSSPEISFEELAQAMGVSAERVWKPSQVEPAIQRMLASPGPYLINLVITGDVHPELIGVRCGQ
jgi:benzoylformate decarboxylase